MTGVPRNSLLATVVKLSQLLLIIDVCWLELDLKLIAFSKRDASIPELPLVSIT